MCGILIYRNVLSFNLEDRKNFTIPTTPSQYLRLLINDELINKIITFKNMKGAELASTPKKVQKRRGAPMRVRPLTT